MFGPKAIILYIALTFFLLGLYFNFNERVLEWEQVSRYGGSYHHEFSGSSLMMMGYVTLLPLIYLWEKERKEN